jgi:hypothetical protein
VNAALHARLASGDDADVIPAEDAVDALRTIFLSKRQDGDGSEGNGSLVPQAVVAETGVEAPATGPAPIEPAPIEAPYPTPPQVAAPIGPVLAETEGRLAEEHAYGLDLHRPSPVKHPHIPRPADEAPAPVPTSRRERRREKKRRKEVKPEAVDRRSAIMEAQFAHMSAAGRRLYGLEPLPDERQRERLDQADLARMMEAGEPSDRPDR